MNMDPFADSPPPSRHNLQTSELPEAHQYRQKVVLDEVMKASKLFHGLQPQEIAEIVACLQLVKCKKGECVLERDIWHGRLYFIASGQVSVVLQDGEPGGGEEGTAFTTPTGQARPGQDSGKRKRSGAQSHIINQLGPGECFGEMSLITGDPPSATIRAERDTVLWSLTHLDFMTLISACPTLLSNINAILAQRLARLNRHIGPAHTAERVWLALVENPGAPLERSLAFHIADALAVRSRKRVLLIDMGEQDALLALHFATHSDQMRPSLLECARDPGSLRKHQAPMMTSDGRHYPAITTLLPEAFPKGHTSDHLYGQVAFGGSESGDFDITSILRDLSGFYDYLLLVTACTTPPTGIETVARNCSRAVLLISSDAVGREAEYAPSLPLAPGSEAFSVPYSIFIAHVPEHPTIGAQDRYAKLLGRSVTRLLPADTSLLEESWKRRVALSEAAPHSALTQAVDFVARHIAHLTVGIAFGGGGARGFAHLGAFERLLHYGIPVDYLAGCSIGVLPPTLYLMGKSFAECEELFLDIHRHIVHLGLPRMSIFSNRGLKREVRKHCGELRFEDLSAPLAMVAVDLATRTEVVLDRGPLWLAALASVSIPGIFPPLTIGDHMLIDAGMHDPVPTRTVRKMGADILLALDVDDREPLLLESATPWLEEAKYTPGRKSLSPHFVDVLLRAYEISNSTINMHSDLEADVVIRPQTRSVSLLQFSKGHQLVAAGREAVEQSLPALRGICAAKHLTESQNMDKMIYIQGSHFKDAYGRTRILRGVNLGGSSKIPLKPDGATHMREGFFEHRTVSFVGRPFPLEQADEHFARLREWGLTCLRFLVTWEAIEHAGPGIYDQAYLDYVYTIIKKADAYGMQVLIDPHQDVWSRFCGGDGAPGWTFEAVGMDITKFQEAGAALVHQLYGGPLPSMIWPTNGAKLAAATMFTLFFGGDDFAPALRVEGVPVQDYLQRHYIGAIKQIALRVGELPNVIGYGTMNEPLSGFIGCTDANQYKGILKSGECPTVFQSLLLGAGYPQTVEVWEQRVTGPRLIGRRLVNPKRVRVWCNGANCVWRQHGVWDVAADETPCLLRPNYFSLVNERQVDFSQDYYRPFANRFAREIRSADPDALIFLETEVGHIPPRWQAEDVSQIVYAPHWYDGFVLYLKQYSPFFGFDMLANKLVIGPRSIRTSFARQLATYKQHASQFLHGAPVLIGEFGIPFNLQHKKAYRTGDFGKQIKAMDRSLRALEDVLLNGTVWNYTPDNTNEHGDQWNGEDLSIFSRDQQTNPQDIHSGGRALPAIVRPYARAVAGEPLRMAFDPNRKVFTFAFRHDAAVTAPTELFVPNYQYPRGYAVEVSDGSVEIDREQQVLRYHHTTTCDVHTIRLSSRGGSGGDAGGRTLASPSVENPVWGTRRLNK